MAFAQCRSEIDAVIVLLAIKPYQNEDAENREKDLPFSARYGKISFARGCSPVGQSASFTSKRSWVRAPPSPPKKEPINSNVFGSFVLSITHFVTHLGVFSIDSRPMLSG